MNHEPPVTPCASASSERSPKDPYQPAGRPKRSARYPSPAHKLRGYGLRLIGPDPDTQEPDDLQCVVSDDGNLAVLLRGLDRGGTHRLYVERVHRTTPMDVVAHSMLFGSEQDFVAWCETDPIRFEPHVASQVRRIGHELLEAR